MNAGEQVNGQAMTPDVKRPRTPENHHEATVELIGHQHMMIRERDVEIDELRAQLWGARRRADYLGEVLDATQAELAQARAEVLVLEAQREDLEAEVVRPSPS